MQVSKRTDVQLHFGMLGIRSACILVLYCYVKVSKDMWEMSTGFTYDSLINPYTLLKETTKFEKFASPRRLSASWSPWRGNIFSIGFFKISSKTYRKARKNITGMFPTLWTAEIIFWKKILHLLSVPLCDLPGERDNLIFYRWRRTRLSLEMCLRCDNLITFR